MQDIKHGITSDQQDILNRIKQTDFQTRIYRVPLDEQQLMPIEEEEDEE